MGLANLTGEVLDEKYRIEKQLGKGGMGAVYLATHLGTDRPVALKVIAPQFMKHDEFVERFRREARAAGRLRSPNVVDVTDFGFARVGADRVAYLVMEYLDGCTLNEILSEETRLPLDWVVDILEQACSAVEEAHQQGIIHRDLKPDNIWLEPNRRGGYTIKVLDFGIAKLDDAPLEASLTSSIQKRAGAPTQPYPHQAETRAALDEAATIMLGDSQTQMPGDEQPSALSSLPPPGTDFAEAGTQLLSPADTNAEAEASTQLLSSPSSRKTEPFITEEEGTLLLDQTKTDEAHTMETAAQSSGSLTRVGSIMGTPHYMSPEQCRGAALNTRADVYSLGVIAYQMLSGRTPFTGDLPTVMYLHMNEPPPPFADKRVPEKVVKVVLSALAKNPEDRPPSAAAFASALRANSEGVGTLLRKALTLWSEHMPTFLRLALLIYLPLLFLTALQIFVAQLGERKLVPVLIAGIVSFLLSLFIMLVSFFTASVMLGVTTRLVTQLLAAPLRQIKLRPAFDYLKKRLRPFAKTTMLANLMVFFGFMFCLLPGVVLMIYFALMAPVLMMEEVKGWKAMKRATELADRSKRTVVAVVFMQVCVPLLLAGLTSSVIALVVDRFKLGGANLVNLAFQIVYMPFTIVLASISAIVTALLYLKARQAGGEPLREVLGQLDEEDLPRNNWQLRMRERLHVSTRVSRS
jgi:serine/threonine protein kinase